MKASLTVAEIAARLDGVVQGDGGIAIGGVAGLREADAGDIAFLADPRYAAAAAATRASAVIVNRDWQGPCPAALIRVERADAAFAKVAALFAPPPVTPPVGRHPTAVVAEDAVLGEGACIGPFCVVEPGARLGARCALFAHCYVGHGVHVGEDCRFYPHVSIREYTRIGDRVVIHNGAVIGSDGFGYVERDGRHEKIPQTGVVVVGNDVEIGANVTIDRARFGRTRIGDGVKLDNLVHVAHNVSVGPHTVMAAQTGIAGSTTVGAHCKFGGQAGVAGHIALGDRVIVGGQAGVTKSIPAGTFVSGYPAAPHEKAMKAHAHLMRLPVLKAKVADLEKRLRALEDR
ncbi:MAG: UDP-3-O-(3-hydroxymyristoyl)glucosamine N-acyltransferase [Kiritimatiellae bacterium]|nr:UDP-3-O-(3-hydroxymyristoyl)glucosamine N-acyltransferase [Kiritimatiellia bacterium]